MAEYMREAEHTARCVEMLTSLCQTCADSLLVVDAQQQVVSANLAATVMFGYDLVDFIALPLQRLLPEVHKLHGGAQEEREQLAHLATGQQRNGGVFPIEVAISDFRSDNGLLTLYIVRDLSDAQVANDLPNLLAQLSPRQRQVLQLVAHGYTSREIAQQLTISVKTVETHRSNIMNKLGVRNVTGLVRFAVEAGLA